MKTQGHPNNDDVDFQITSKSKAFKKIKENSKEMYGGDINEPE